MANSTLAAIQTKVRRITRNPSESQLTTTQLNEYINTFIQYDFPEHLRTFKLHTTFTFYTNPYQDVYPTDEASFAGATTNPLYNFQNIYQTVNPPLYVAGYQTAYTQSREQFFGNYPKINSIAQIATGDGSTTTFTGVISIQGATINSQQQNFNAALLQNEVLFSSLDANKGGLALVDVPVVDATTGYKTTVGNLYAPNNLPTTPPTTVIATNTINYSTGVFTITFPVAPGAQEVINSQTVPTQLSIPQSICYYNNQFIIRPVPDQPYRVQLEAYVRPTELLSTSDSPQLEEWWQYIAYGAVKKVFEDKMDVESVALIMPEFKKQEALVNRRTIVQITNERTATFYQNQSNWGPGCGGWGFGGGNF